MTSPPGVLLGAQRPRHSSSPPAVTSAGQEAVDLAASAGLQLDPWQQFVLDRALGERSDGRWAAFEVGLVVARQNGKGAVLSARELAGLFLFGEQLILHSAHLFRTSQDAFERVEGLVRGAPDLHRRVKRYSYGNGEEGIELYSGARLQFIARSKQSGRGLSPDTVILDEAAFLAENAKAALLFALSARPNPQLWYTSSAVDQSVHTDGLELARIRRRGLAGSDRSLAYLEWSVDEDVYHSDPDAVGADPAFWAQANPGLGIRLSIEQTEREHRSTSSRAFAVERLSVGDWPSDDEAAEAVIPAEVWARLADSSSSMRDPVVFAVDVSPGQASAAIGVAGRRADLLEHVELVDHRPRADWVVARAVELQQRWEPAAWVLDPAGPAGALLADLRDRGIEPVETSARAMAQACGAFYNAVTGNPPTLRQHGEPALAAALAGARKRELVDSWAWSRKDSSVDISPLVAVTLARYGLTVQPPPAPVPPAPVAVPATSGDPSGLPAVSDLATIGF